MNFRHGGIVSLLAVFIVALTTVLFSALFVLRGAVRSEVQRFEENPAIVAFPAESVTDASLKELDNAIRRMEAVGRTVLVSKDEALARSRRIFGDQSALLLEGFEKENPLPRSIEIYPADGYRHAEAVTAMAAEIKGLDGIENVVYESQSLRTMERIKNAILLLGALIALISIVVISFSIMLTIYARRDELAILQLVGATYAFIRVPLLLQGCFEGFLGSELGLLIFYLLYRYFGRAVGLEEFLGASEVALIVLGATVIGFLGGMLPMRRRLRVAEP